MKTLFKILATALFIISGFTGCKSTDAQSDEIATVDVTKSYPQKELILQDFLDVEYIPLETSDEFITSAYVQAVSKEIILVRNINQAGAGNIFVFDRKGKGLKKINRRGQGAEEYMHITGLVALDEDDNEIFVNTSIIRKMMGYDLLGNFKRSMLYTESKDMLPQSIMIYNPIYSFDRNHLIVQDCVSGRDCYGPKIKDLNPRNIFLIISKQDGSVIKEIQIPFEKKVFQGLIAENGGVLGMLSNPGLIPYRDGWILTEASADTIYSYSPDHKLQPLIVRTPSVQDMDPEIFLYPGVITDRYYFLQTIKKEHDPTELQSNLLTTDLVYDRKEKNAFEYIVYNNDFTTKRAIANLVHKQPILTVINSDEIAFAEQIEAFELVEAYEKGQLKGKLKEIAATLNEESNSVIMLAKYKK
ncbi:MAG: 6-bladed beta-propeller [Tannerellaceae bacterium]|jgi:hypothetical protein|nr:6-bladed beta-propeller [Tannerellaceae bacterium]